VVEVVDDALESEPGALGRRLASNQFGTSIHASKAALMTAPLSMSALI
jgi:hypothetical protein